jgi:aminoglycoside phosphotransferase family enzyme/predicted kinase
MTRPTPQAEMPPAELDAAGQRRMVAALQATLRNQAAGAEVQAIETHISFVLVTPALAYKFKKVLAASFLDFTTLARRRHFCEEELRLNRRLAPALYLDVSTVTGTPDAPQIGGSGPVLDIAVKMRAFEQAGLWDRLARQGALMPSNIDALVTQLASFHRGIAVAGTASEFGSPAHVRAPMLDNLAEIPRLLPGAEDRAAIETLRRWEAATFADLEPALAERQRAGWVRECHGDLHLGNVAQVDGATTVFDGIEFNDDFRWIDVMSEIAFMAMDLYAHGRADLAHRFVNGCVEASGDFTGMRVLRYYTVHRALVRAKIAALRAGQTADAADLDAARRSLALAVALSEPGEPALLITHGFSGSGKTTLTQGLLETLGAIRVRSDVERKRLFGVAPLQRGAAPYTAEATAATYARLGEAAAAVLEAGQPVILDAAFLRRHERDAARRWAASHRVPFVLLDFDVDPATLRERVQARTARNDDASDADLAVLEGQLRSAEALGDDERTSVFSCRPAAGTARVEWAPLIESLRARQRR